MTFEDFRTSSEDFRSLLKIAEDHPKTSEDLTTLLEGLRILPEFLGSFRKTKGSSALVIGKEYFFNCKGSLSTSVPCGRVLLFSFGELDLPWG